jgi:hypothetical protein
VTDLLDPIEAQVAEVAAEPEFEIERTPAK